MVRAFDTPITTTDQSIERVLNAGLPVALVFLGGGLAPAGLDETMNRLARENAGKLLVVKVQVKDSPQITSRYAINRAPAIVSIKNGQVQSRAEGIAAADLLKHVEFLLDRGPKPAPEQHSQPSSERTGAATGEAGMQVVTDATFDQEVMHSTKPVLVDFWAPWCGPCRMTEPIVKKLAQEMSARLKVAKVNVDENPAISQRYGIQSIPTMMVVKNGKVVDRWVGALPEQAVRTRITPLVNGA